MEMEELEALRIKDREMEIPVTGLYGMKFIIVKMKMDKYALYKGERQTARNFVGVFASLDKTYDAIERKCKKERCDKCQTKLLIN